MEMSSSTSPRRWWRCAGSARSTCTLAGSSGGKRGTPTYCTVVGSTYAHEASAHASTAAGSLMGATIAGARSPRYWTLVLFLLLQLRGAHQAPLAVDLAKGPVVRALAPPRLAVDAHLLAGMGLPLEDPQHGELAARARPGVLPAQDVVLLALGERLARGVQEHAQVLLVVALGRRVLEQRHPVLRRNQRAHCQ